MAANLLPEISADRFWQWSLAIYPEVKACSLEWQDNFAVNINLLLLLLYLQRNQVQLQPFEIQQLSHACQQHNQHFTQVLRKLRRQTLNVNLAACQTELKESFKQMLLQAELESEKIEQQLLLHQYALLSANRGTVDGNCCLLRQYLQLFNVSIDERIQAQIFDLDQASRTVSF